jgi:hypothetical protein
MAQGSSLNVEGFITEALPVAVYVLLSIFSALQSMTGSFVVGAQ